MTKTSNNYKRIIASICIFLALCMAVLLPLQVYAQSTNVKYLSDIKLFYAEDSDEAKETAEKEGFTFLNNNLNEGTGKDTEVYLGYKTTTNEDMAVTDIRMLGMESGFQLYDYKQMIEYLKNQHAGTAQTMLETAEEFIDYYDAGSERALDAYEGLNLFYVDNAKMPLGDYIIEGKADIDFFMEVMMRSNASTVNAVIGFLNSGIAKFENAYDEETGEVVTKNWAETLPESSVNDILEGDPTTDELKDLKKQYHDQAAGIFRELQTFATNYENALARHPGGTAKVDTSIDTPEEAIEDSEDMKSEDTDVVVLETYNKLNEYQYNDEMKLGEWLVYLGNKTSDEINLTELYALADVLGEAQSDLVADAGILTAVSNLGENKANEKFEETLPEIKEKINDYSGKDYLSLWESADDDIRNSIIAFTSEAVRKQAAENLNLKTEENDVLQEKFTIVMKWIGIGLGIAYVALFVTAKIITVVYLKVVSLALYSLLGKILAGLGYVAAIQIWAALIVAVVTIAMLLYFWISDATKDEETDVEHIRTPEYVIDAIQAGKEVKTIKYKTVLCNGTYSPELILNEYNLGDLNARRYKRWNTLCYTKSKQVGSPIRMDDDDNIFKVVKGDSKTPGGYAPLRAFGERNAGNANTYCTKDTVGGIYIFYRTNDSIEGEAPASAPAQTQTTDTTKSGYITEIYVATAQTEAQAKAKITKRQGKYYIFDKNLSPQAGYATFIGYMISEDESDAITDIRIAPYNGSNAVNYGDIQYIYGGTVGCNMGGSESNENSQTDGLLFTRDKRAGSPLGADSLHYSSSFVEPEKGWEPVTTFCGGMPYDFNVTHIRAGDNSNISGYQYCYQTMGGNETKKYDHASSYLYFEPTETYTGGEKYLSGVFFLAGFEKGDSFYLGPGWKEIGSFALFSSFKKEKSAMKNLSVCETNLAQSINYGQKQHMHLAYTYSYNPKRAIYDIAVFEGAGAAATLPYQVSKAQPSGNSINYVACNVFGQYAYPSNDNDQDRAYDYASAIGTRFFRAIAPGNIYCNRLGIDVDRSLSANENFFRYVKDQRSRDSYCRADVSGDYVKFGMAKTLLPTLGLYVSGCTKDKDPLRLCDVVISEKEHKVTCRDGSMRAETGDEQTLDGSRASGDFHSVFLLENPNCEKPFNLSFPAFGLIDEEGKYVWNYASAKCHIYLRGKTKDKAKYISALTLGSYSRKQYKESGKGNTDDNALKGVDASVDISAVSSAVSSCTDEVLMTNFALNPSQAWYNRKDEGGFLETSALEDNRAAYIGVTRTSNAKKAITGALLLQNDSSSTYNEIKLNTVEYYCSSSNMPVIINDKKYYLYYTYNTGVNAGQPIEDIAIDDIPLVGGSATALCAKYGDKKPHADTAMEMFLHLKYDHSASNLFYNKLYIGSGVNSKTAKLNLMEQECVELLDICLNTDGGGNALYFGFRYGSRDDNIINSYSDKAKREEEYRRQMKEAVCDVIITQDEPYHPEGFIAKNHIYYNPVSDVNLNEGNNGYEMYMYYACDCLSNKFNEKNNAATYLPMDVFKPVQAFAMARYDRVPYTAERVYMQSGGIRSIKWEYVMLKGEKKHADFNAGVAVIDDDGNIKGDNRLTMFIQRYDGDVKPSAEITGGFVADTANVGELHLNEQE